MGEDKSHLASFDAMILDLSRIHARLVEKRAGEEDKVKLAMAFLDSFEELEDSIFRHHRICNFLLGRPYEAQAISAEAVLIGVGGGGL